MFFCNTDIRNTFICIKCCTYGVTSAVCDVVDAPKLFPDPTRTGQAVGYQRTLVCHIDALPQPSLDPESNQLYWSFQSQRLQPSER